MLTPSRCSRMPRRRHPNRRRSAARLRRRSRTSASPFSGARRTVFGSTWTSPQARRCEKPRATIRRSAASRRAVGDLNFFPEDPSAQQRPASTPPAASSAASFHPPAPPASGRQPPTYRCTSPSSDRRAPSLLLAQDADNLRLPEPALLHVRLLGETDSHSKRGIWKGARQAAQTGLLPTPTTPAQINYGLLLWLDEKRGSRQWGQRRSRPPALSVTRSKTSRSETPADVTAGTQASVDQRLHARPRTSPWAAGAHFRFAAVRIRRWPQASPTTSTSRSRMRLPPVANAHKRDFVNLTE